MVNTLILVATVASFLVWLVQELFARKQMQSKLDGCISSEQKLSAEQLMQTIQPQWSEWLFKALLAVWAAWVASVVLVKDGDFALVLVLLTLLAGIIAGLDRLLFMSGRELYLNSKTVAAYLGRYAGEQGQRLKELVGQEWVVGEYARSFFPVLLVVLVLRSFVVEPFQIPSASMVPTLEIGDYILVNKFSYGIRLPVVGTKIVDIGEPKRGDVIVFFPPNDDRYFIKRVIGLPGDQITYRDKVLYINGQELPQKLIADYTFIGRHFKDMSEDLAGVSHQIRIGIPFKDSQGRLVQFDNPQVNNLSVTVQPGHYFMMGDNRDNSSDSRVWGQVPEENVVGKAFAIWMHWASFGELPSFKRVGIIE